MKYEAPYLKELKPDATLTMVDQAFPAHALKLMPRMEDIPKEFREGHTIWHKLQHDSFYSGIQGFQAVPQEGIDVGVALRHLQCINGSFEPKHEHKCAAFAYLASLWFKEVRYEPLKKAQ